MERGVHRLFFTFIVALALPAEAARNAASAATDASEQELTLALQDALSVNAEAAIRRLGRQDGFVRNERVHIPLPDGLSRAASTLRRLGMARYPVDLETNLNRAAEAAVPELRAPFLEAIARVTFADARAMGSAGDETAVQYFRRKTYNGMTVRFLPAVHSATRRLQVADSYQQVARRAAKVGLLRADTANLDDYITAKALDAVYATMAEEERAMRTYPIRQTQKTLRRISGAQ
jgi:Protein of unknown function (DUF4197)